MTTVKMFGILAFVAASVGSSGAAVARVKAQEEKPNLALVQVSECVANTHRAVVLLVMDESGSLKQTDPKNERVTAAKSAIESLSGLAEHPIDGEKPIVDVAVAGFGVDYSVVVDWQSINYANVESVRGSVDQFATRNSALDTDYVAAIRGARESLNKKVKEISSPQGACAVLMWFTDGRFDIEDRTTAARREKGKGTYKPWSAEIDLAVAGNGVKAVAAGKKLLCDPAGEADQLRGESVTTVTVALTTQLEQQDQDFLRALTTGLGGGETCGQQAGDKLGFFTPVDDVSELIASFDAIANVLGYGTQGQPQKDMAPGSRRTFPVDIGMSRFHFQVQTGEPGRTVTLEPVGTPAFKLEPTGTTETALGRGRIRYAWLSPDVASVDVYLPSEPYDFAGDWTIALGDGSTTGTGGFRIFYYGDLTAALEPGSIIKRKDSSELRIKLTEGGIGKPPPKAYLDAVTIDAIATVDNGNGPITVKLDEPTDDGTLIGQYSPAQPGKGEKARVAVDLSVKTKSGFALHPNKSTFETKFDSAASGTTAKSSGSSIPLIPILGVIGVALAALGVILFRRKGLRLPDYSDVRYVVTPIRIRRDDLNRPTVLSVTSGGVERPLSLGVDDFADALPEKRRAEVTIEGFVISPISHDEVSVGMPGHLILSGEGSGEASSSVELSSVFAPNWFFARPIESRAGMSMGQGGASRRGRFKTTQVVEDGSPWSPTQPDANRTVAPNSPRGGGVPTIGPKVGNGHTIRIDGPVNLPGSTGESVESRTSGAQTYDVSSGPQPSIARPYVEGWLLVVVRDPRELESIDHALKYELPTRAFRSLGA